MIRRAALLTSCLAFATCASAQHEDILPLKALATAEAARVVEGAKELLLMIEHRASPDQLERGSRWLRDAAERGKPEAQFQLGLHAEHGNPKDIRAAVDWYLKAAEACNAVSQARLAAMYTEGDCVAKDEARAVSWLEKGAHQGHVGSQGQLGAMYLLGRGVPKNLDKAIEWLTPATRAGDPDARKLLASALAEKRAGASR